MMVLGLAPVFAAYGAILIKTGCGDSRNRSKRYMASLTTFFASVASEDGAMVEGDEYWVLTAGRGWKIEFEELWDGRRFG